jgi:hypothetical protein
VTCKTLQLHKVWNNQKGKQIELFWSNVDKMYTVRTYQKVEKICMNGYVSTYYDLIAHKNFSLMADALKYADRLTRAKAWVLLTN